MREIRRCTDIPGDNAARERSRVKSLRAAFADLQRALPCVPPDTKLSKLDVLVLGKVTYLFINILTKSCFTFQKCRRKLGKRKRKKDFTSKAANVRNFVGLQVKALHSPYFFSFFQIVKHRHTSLS